jgi:glycosyltransferase involved in cell wall biosynthesis
VDEKISIVIPVYNTGKAAVKLVLSIIKGPYKNLEILIIDDGSTDDSYLYIKEFVRQYSLKFNGKNSPSIKLFHQENSGVSAARNLGIEKSTGKLIAFTDSDDKVDKTFYQKLHDTIVKYDGLNSKDLKVGLVVSGVRYERLGTKHKKNIYLKEVKLRQPDEDFYDFVLRLMYTDGRLYAVSNKLYRNDIIKHFDLHFDETMSFAEDVKFNLNYLNYANRVHYSRIEFILEPLYHYFYGTPTSIVGDSSLSWGNWLKSFKDVEKFAGKKPSKKKQQYLKRVLSRWKVSHALAVARSKQSFGHKLQHTPFFKLIAAEIIVKFRR